MKKKPAESRIESPSSLRKTFKKIQRLILTNVTDVRNVRWITLTYAENMMDTDDLYEDFRKFNQRFQYFCGKKNYGKAEYIVIAEPQGRGAWHWHLFYIWDKKAPFIANDILAECWGKGFVKIQQLKDTDNIAGYLTAYLSNVETDSETASYFSRDNVLEMENGEGQKKYYIKGGRLHLYPSHFNMIRHSQGIKQPIKEVTTMYKARKYVEGMEKTYQSSYILSDDKGFNTTIVKAEYRIPRNGDTDNSDTPA
jgi:hypothetical protein